MKNLEIENTGQKALTKGVQSHYDNKQNDRNLQLAQRYGHPGIINHHFGLGPFEGDLAQMNQAEIARAIDDCEMNQTELFVQKMGNVGNDSHVLDAGSGRGGTAFSIHQKHGATVIGISISEYQVDFSNRLAKEFWKSGEVEFVHMNMLDLHFSENYFSHVVTNETTMYFTDLTPVFTELFRVLKPEGQYTLATWCINDEKFKEAQPNVTAINGHYSCYINTRSHYLHCLQAAGFCEIEVFDLTEDVVPHWELRSNWEEAAGIENNFLVGHKSRQILYLMMSAKKSLSIS